jgi:hypothetical protein
MNTIEGGPVTFDYFSMELTTLVRTFQVTRYHRRIARSGHELPKVLPGTAKPDPSTASRRPSLIGGFRGSAV